MSVPSASKHTECLINNVLTIGFVDSGAEETLIKESFANQLELKIEEHQRLIMGYGNIKSGNTIGVAEVQITLGTYQTNHKVWIVPNQLQEEDVVIGLDLIGKPDIVGKIAKGKWWFYPQPDEDQEERKNKVTLRAARMMTIPANSLRYCQTSTEDITKDNGPIFVEKGPRGPKMFIPDTMTSQNGYIPVINRTETDMVIRRHQVIARGTRAILDEDIGEDYQPSRDTTKEDIRICSTKNRKMFTLEELDQVMEPTTSKELKRKLLELINKYRDCFARETSELGKAKDGALEIRLMDNEPIAYRPYRLSYKEREWVKKQIDELKEHGLIRDSTSPYATPILLVKKKDGSTRMCCDFRRLNAKTIKDHYPLPRIDDLIDRLRNVRWISTLDLTWGYWQLPVHPDSVEKTAFVTPDGQYEWLRLPFGLSNGPPVYQRLMDSLLQPLVDSSIFAYLDDVMVGATTAEENLKKLEVVFKTLRDAGLTLRFEKCAFLKTKVHYLGHEIENGEIRPGQEKMPAVEKFPTPRNVHEVRRFLGLTGYFRKFIKDYSRIAAPISDLTKKDVPFKWTEAQEDAANKLKKKLLEQPVLAIYDTEAETELHTDASCEGIGAILMQRQKSGKMKPVLYFSQRTTPEERKYHSYELETLAIVRSLQRMRPYLYGRQFKIITDCAALRFTLTKKDINPRIARWWLLIQEFDFEVQYRPGTRMRHVDSLSRAAVQQPTEEDLRTIADLLPINAKRAELPMSSWIAIAQTNDERCQEIRDIYNNGTKKQKTKLQEEFTVKKEAVYKKTPEGLRWVVPRAARAQVVRMWHDDIGHPGVEKTLDGLKERVWFPKMKKYVEDYLRACLSCLFVKKNRNASAGDLHVYRKPTQPMDTLHMDHLGPFLTTARKNTHILVTVDSFTKYVWLHPTRQAGASPCIKFAESLFQVYGIPRRIIADRGKAFDCTAFRTFCTELGVKLTLVAVATPRANGQVERMNSTILDKLIAAVEEQEEKWDKHLPDVQRYINSTQSAATGKTPNELFFGYRLRHPENAFFAQAVDEEILEKMEAENSTTEFEETRQKIREEAIKKNLENQIKMAARTQGRRPPQTFKVGDYVTIPHANPSTKLKKRNKGPFVVTEVLPNDRYTVENTHRQRRYRNVHAPEHLRKIVVNQIHTPDEPTTQRRTTPHCAAPNEKTCAIKNWFSDNTTLLHVH